MRSPSSSRPGTEAEARADFSILRYAQCWEDADVLLEALDVRPDHICLSIASAGDNALSLLSRGPARVIAVDLNPAQLACVELRVAAYRTLSHPELLRLIGSQPGDDRQSLYAKCRSLLSEDAQRFWDAHSLEVAAGIGSAGKFENYFRLFRRRVLPLVHSRSTVDRLLQPRSRVERETFYEQTWNNWRWRLLFRVFFSRYLMGKLGRDPAFFEYVEGSVAERISDRVRHALTVLPPEENPYLRWILTESHAEMALPHALRPENFEAIRNHLDRLEWHQQPIEALLDSKPDLTFDRFNLSDIFEYMSEDATATLLTRLVGQSNIGARLAYWNMLAPRSRPDAMGGQLVSLMELAERLHFEDKAFFYSRFVVEEVRAS